LIVSSGKKLTFTYFYTIIREVKEKHNCMNKSAEKSPSVSLHPHGFREVIKFYLIDSRTALGKTIDIIILLFNILFIALFILETYDISYSVLVLVENVIVSIFIIEYAARLYGASSRIRHLYNIFSIIDLVAILPSILQPFIGTGNIGILKLLRIFRVFRVLRFLRFFETTEFFFGKISDEMLKTLRLVLTVFMIFFVSSGLFYIVEYQQNEIVNNFGDAFYFTVVALTTVGFGDITPISGAGKAVTVLCIISGIILIPWQVGEIVREWLRIAHKATVVCKHCGLKYHDRDAAHCKACGNLIYQDYVGE